MKNKFDFYEIVKVIGKAPGLKEVYGKQGIVIGMSQCEKTNEWGYAVDLFDEDEGWDFMEKDLESMNCFGKREDVYPGKSVKISVDPKTGKGDLVENDN